MIVLLLYLLMSCHSGRMLLEEDTPRSVSKFHLLWRIIESTLATCLARANEGQKEFSEKLIALHGNCEVKSQHCFDSVQVLYPFGSNAVQRYATAML